ncbi:MAG: SCO family protein [Verrucomicrobia bacterium]|nr:SCO family protein [Verrucomicrobiota bacterium]
MEEIATPSSARSGLWTGLALTAVILALSLVVAKLPRGAGQAAQPLPVLGRVSPFTLTNQLGQETTLAKLQGQIWIADVIFTRCQSSCLNLTRRMAALQSKLPPGDKVQLISLSADPEYDTPAVFRKYAETHQADSARWQFLTGSKKEVYRLAVEDLKFVVLDKSQEKREPLEEMFVHSTLFAVVDPRGQVRGYFDGATPTAQEQVLAAVRQLLKEK